MPKHNRKGPKAPSGDMRPLLLALVRDLYEHLPDPDKLISLISREDASGSVVRAYVDSLLVDAESSLHSISIDRFAAVRQLAAFLQKNTTGAISSTLRKQAALEKFERAEQKCRRTNRRLLWFKDRMSRLPSVLQDVLAEARQDIFSLLGAFSPDDLEACLEGCDFGPGLTYGATSQDHRHLYYKVGGEPLTYTRGCVPHLPLLREVFPRWFNTLVELDVKAQEVPGNRLTVVPKTAKIDRVIAIEPSLNVFLQKGIESRLRHYLLKWGVTIRDQTRNHLPVRIGSVNGAFASIDLSSASDCVSLELVRWLLPPGWTRFIESVRCPMYTLDKGETWHEYQKFSSMGNATTFPLESLIFMALVRASCRVTGTPLTGTRVYGDDIVAPRNVALLLLEVLAFCGFTPNSEKTFIFGPFRESCGVDYLSGVDVRPVYLKRYPRTEAEVFNLFNRLRVNRYGFRFSNTLRYLWDSIAPSRRSLSPADLPAGDQYWRWYAGSAIDYDRGFHVPQHCVSRYRGRSRVLQSSMWRVPSVGTRIAPKDGTFREELALLVFLLGVKAGEVLLPSWRVTYRSYQTYYTWGEFGWWPLWMWSVRA